MALVNESLQRFLNEADQETSDASGQRGKLLNARHILGASRCATALRAKLRYRRADLRQQAQVLHGNVLAQRFLRASR